MRYIATLLLMFTIQGAQAASVQFFQSNVESEIKFSVIPSAYIEKIDYDEDDKELTLWHMHGKGYDFKVDSAKEANEIIIKLMDKNDNSLIVLTES